MGTLLDAPPEAVWEAIRDVAGHTQWMEDAVAIRFTSERREGVGTTFECDTKVGPLRLTDRMELTEWEPAKVMGVRHTGVVGGVGRFTLTPARTPAGRDGTRFEWDEELRFPWWMGGPIGAFVGGKLVLGWVWRTNLKNLQRLIADR